MELQITELGHTRPSATMSTDVAQFSIPLSTLGAWGRLDFVVLERVVNAGTPEAYFELTVRVLHYQGDKRAVLLNHTTRTDDVDVNAEDRMRRALHTIARPTGIGEGCLDAMSWVRLAQGSARHALFPAYVADGSWSWDNDGPILPGEPGTPMPGSVAELVQKREKEEGQ